MPRTAADTLPVGPVLPAGQIPVTETHTATEVTLHFTSPAGADLVYPKLDGKWKLTDGKQHPNTTPGLSQITIGRPQDGQPHRYGIDVYDKLSEGEVTV